MTSFLHKTKQLLRGFVLPKDRFDESRFLPLTSHKSTFEVLRAPKLVRKVGIGLAIVLSAGFAALQVTANPLDDGSASTVDNYVNITTVGQGGQRLDGCLVRRDSNPLSGR